MTNSLINSELAIVDGTKFRETLLGIGPNAHGNSSYPPVRFESSWRSEKKIPTWFMTRLRNCEQCEPSYENLSLLRTEKKAGALANVIVGLGQDVIILAGFPCYLICNPTRRDHANPYMTRKAFRSNR